MLAFLVVCLKGVLLLRSEKAVLFTRDPARALAMAERACQKRHVEYSRLTGDAVGVEVTGRVRNVRAVRRDGERDNWLSPIPVSRLERR